ncbi:DsbA family protein [Aestuariicoccus sp. MJ-SS9]|uniref:DsbA family protein n=1 Tax=Aestuariicoccus sp. MJ-SS9 TaxID=3079855 RepID=UPI002913CEBE|nr:DsbA family protein [Aestuariicoccus sp. MJ-SS9]MDU8911776.1 DsbA family protein [Aestuariicoccus sp. MJ-SS9]
MKRIATSALLAIGLLAGGGWWISQQAAPKGAEIVLPGAASAQTAADVEIVEMVQGNADAAVEVIEYASYTCPHCANFHANTYKQLKADYIDTGKIKFTYREVYFDKYGMWASLIARCEPSKFFGITDLVYKGQQDWARAGSDAAIAGELRKIGLLAGVDKDKLESCLSDGTKLRALVEWYQANAEEHGITSTPSFVINGTKYSNMPYDEFKSILDDELG